MERAEAGALSYGGQRLLDMGLALATKPRVLLLDEPLAGLAAAERQRIGDIIKRISSDMPVLLVEHDIDRVFQIADAVTVMNEGQVLVDGTVEDARSSPKVQEVYIGSGAATLAAKPRESAAEPATLLDGGRHQHLLRQEPHPGRTCRSTVHEHEIVALLGRNGAGKSTLLKTLIGIAPPASGVDPPRRRTSIAGLPSAEIARLGIGYVPQGRGLFAGMTVAQNLELGRLKRQTGHGVRWDLERIFEYFPRIRERLDTPADFLSGGEQQMVAVARALSGDVRVLLLDEPFEGLAPTIVEQLFESFDKLRHEVSIIIVDHHLDLALALSDRTVALERGRVIHYRAVEGSCATISRCAARCCGCDHPRHSGAPRSGEPGTYDRVHTRGRLIVGSGLALRAPRNDRGREIEMPTVAIVGAGLIGRSWAIVFARAGWEVRLTDPSADQLAAAPLLIRQGLDELAAHGLAADPAAAARRVSAVASLAEAVGGVDLVQENGPELVEIKRELFAELDRLAPDGAILASSTSAIVASRFTETLARSCSAASSRIRSTRRTSCRSSSCAARPGRRPTSSSARGGSTTPSARCRSW